MDEGARTSRRQQDDEGAPTRRSAKNAPAGSRTTISPDTAMRARDVSRPAPPRPDLPRPAPPRPDPPRPDPPADRP